MTNETLQHLRAYVESRRRARRGASSVVDDAHIEDDVFFSDDDADDVEFELSLTESLSSHIASASLSRSFDHSALAPRQALAYLSRVLGYGVMAMSTAAVACLLTISAIVGSLHTFLGETAPFAGLLCLVGLFTFFSVHLLNQTLNTHGDAMEHTPSFGGLDVVETSVQCLMRISDNTNTLLSRRVEESEDSVRWSAMAWLPTGEKLHISLSQCAERGDIAVRIEKEGRERVMARRWVRPDKGCGWILKAIEGSDGGIGAKGQSVTSDGLEAQVLGALDAFLATNVRRFSIFLSEEPPMLTATLKEALPPEPPSGRHAVELDYELSRRPDVRPGELWISHWSRVACYWALSAVVLASPLLIASLLLQALAWSDVVMGAIYVHTLTAIFFTACVGSAVLTLPQLLKGHPKMPRVLPRTRRVSRKPVLSLDGVALEMERAVIYLDCPFSLSITRLPTSSTGESSRVRLTFDLRQSIRASRGELRFAVDVSASASAALEGVEALERYASLVPESDFHTWLWPAIAYGLAAQGKTPRLDFQRVTAQPTADAQPTAARVYLPEAPASTTARSSLEDDLERAEERARSVESRELEVVVKRGG